jgi:putative membrane protein
MEIVGLIFGILIGAVISAVIIWIVGKLGLGIEVDGFGPAFIAALVIAVVSGLITWLLGLVGVSIGGGLLGAIVHLIIAAIVLMVAGNLVSGLRVKGFVGALIAAIAIGAVGWLMAWLASLIA